MLSFAAVFFSDERRFFPLPLILRPRWRARRPFGAVSRAVFGRGAGGGRRVEREKTEREMENESLIDFVVSRPKDYLHKF